MDDYDKAVFLQQNEDAVEARFRDWLPEVARPQYDQYVSDEKELLSSISRAFQECSSFSGSAYYAQQYMDFVVDNFRGVMQQRRKWLYWKRKWSITDGFDPRNAPTMVVEHSKENHNLQIEKNGALLRVCVQPPLRARTMNETEITVLEDTSVSSNFDELCAIIQGLKRCIPYGIVSMTWTRRTLTAKVIMRRYSGRPDLERLGKLSEEDFVAEATRELRCAAMSAKLEYRRRS